MTPGQLLPSSFPDVAADVDADVDADADADEGPGSEAELFPGADVDAFPGGDSDAFSGSDAYWGVGTFPGAGPGPGILTLAVSTSFGIGIPLDFRIGSTSLCLAPMWKASLSWLWNNTSHWEQLFVSLTKFAHFSVSLVK